MNTLRGRRKTVRSPIPISIGRPSGSKGSTQAFVVSFVDAVASPDTYKNLRKAEDTYRNAVRKWKRYVQKLRKRRSDPVPRWRLADEIKAFESHLMSEWGFYATNTLDAVSWAIGLSKSSLGYVMKLRERFALDEVKNSGINWSKLQEVLDIRDQDLMKKCVRLIKRGEITRDSEIRIFKREANSSV